MSNVDRAFHLRQEESWERDFFPQEVPGTQGIITTRNKFLIAYSFFLVFFVFVFDFSFAFFEVF